MTILTPFTSKSVHYFRRYRQKQGGCKKKWGGAGAGVGVGTGVGGNLINIEEDKESEQIHLSFL